MPTAYSYIRFSSPEQTKGDSLRRQLELSERYARENGLVLDESLKLQDLGLSAYHEAHIEKGALGVFLENVRAKRVEPGSFLLVESLDRLSRANVLTAMGQFLDIVKAGITIVTLADGNEYSQKSGTEISMQLMMSLLIMTRAHEESATKSKRLKAVWGKKKQDAAQGKRVTSQLPAWLKAEGEKIVLNEPKAKIVIDIFNLMRSGYGVNLLERKLHEDGVPPIGRAKRWHKSYLLKLIHNKAVIGEYQPMSNAGSKRVLAGDPIKNYFPALLTSEEFYATQQAIKDRTTKGGRKGEGIANVFSGLLRCGYCNGPIRYVNKNSATNWQYVVCSDAKSGLGCRHVPWNYNEFEAQLLSQLADLDVEAILKDEQAQKARDELEALKGLLIDVRKKMKSLIKLAEHVDDVEQLTTRLQVLKDEELQLQKQQRILGDKSMMPALGRHPLERFRALRQRMDESDSTERQEIRLRISTELKRLVSKIDVYPDGAKPWSTAMRLMGITPTRAGRFAAVIFKGGEGRIIHGTMATLYSPPPTSVRLKVLA